VLALVAGGCGGKSSSAPEIVRFDGPSSVQCGKKATIHTVLFKYETKNVTAVSPEIDGQAIGAQAGYDPQSGTMRFFYKCPGPHEFTISAFGKSKKSVSKTVTVEPEG
jgi:hypothetical protein